MKKILETVVLLSVIISFSFASTQIYANDIHVDSLSSINPELKKFFPRWKVCEPDLQFKIYQSFIVLGFDIDKLDQQNIQVMTAPFNKDKDKSYDVLLLQCGSEAMTSRELDRDMSKITDILSGKRNYKSDSKDKSRATIDYCHHIIPAEIPIKDTEAEVIEDFMRHDNKGQYMSFSLFEQVLKIGESSFWLISKTGNDQIGYPFWLAGENKIILKKPLYQNKDINTMKTYKNLINAYLGAGYKINQGLDGTGLFNNWVSRGMLNSHPKGKINFGFDFHMPFHPDAGVNFNIEIPTTNIENEVVDQGLYLQTPATNRILSSSIGDNNIDVSLLSPETSTSYILGTTGQATLFYNLWLDKNNPENFFKIQLGVSYNEVSEYVIYPEIDSAENKGNGKFRLAKKDISGLTMIKNDEFMDWLYTKVEYRNQAVWPFSISAQISNQIFLTRAYMPLFGNWFYLEAKFATPLRTALPYELENFFIISPVLRIAF